jgi:hypothetical protein
MPRTNITDIELIEWLNDELHKDKENEECEFTSIFKLADNVFDDNGCNWSHANFTCHGAPVDAFIDIKNEIERRAKELFNVQ